MTSSIERLIREDTESVDEDTSAERAIESVVERTPGEDGVTDYYVYVTDGDRLVGVVSMRELLDAEETTPLSEIMTTDLVTVSTDDPLHEVARRIVDGRFVVLPVVDGSGQFVGVVRAADVIGALDEQTTEQLFERAGFRLP